MSLFQFPKGIQGRRLKPYPYKKYKSFKRVLQHEFSRLCVYCRAPDSISAGEYYSFAVDHYRPKSIAKFAALERDYSNLFYCCGPCNSRKGDYWPSDEIRGPHIVNPCEHDMAKHLRLVAATCKYESRSPEGAHMIKLLQLNDDEIVTYRKRVLATIEMAKQNQRALENRLALAEKKFNSGKLAQADFTEVKRIVEERLTTVIEIIRSHDGTKALRPLPRTVT